MMKHEISLRWRVLRLRMRGYTRQQIADMTEIYRQKVQEMTRREISLAWWALWLRRRGYTYQQVANMTGTYRKKARMRIARAFVIERRSTDRELHMLQYHADAELRLARGWWAYEMRYAGHTYKEIGDRFQISAGWARGIVFQEEQRRRKSNYVYWQGLELLEESLQARD